MLYKATCPDCGAEIAVETNVLPGVKPSRAVDLIRMHKTANECAYELRKDEDK